MINVKAKVVSDNYYNNDSGKVNMDYRQLGVARNYYKLLIVAILAIYSHKNATIVCVVM